MASQLSFEPGTVNTVVVVESTGTQAFEVTSVVDATGVDASAAPVGGVATGGGGSANAADNRDGLGGVLGVVLYFLLGVVLMFTIPSEIKNMYERDGRQSPVSAVWGLWFLLPLIGNIIWYVKVQGALNEFWISKGAQAG